MTPAAAFVLALLAAGLFLAATTVAVTATAATAATGKIWSYDLAGELMSPYCPGRTLASCPSPQASELVQWIVVQEAGGATKDQVVEMLIERFGEEILGAPPARGIALWAYLLPTLGFLVGGALVVVVLRRLTKKLPAAPAVDAGSSQSTTQRPGAADDDFATRVDADLAARG